MDRLLALGVVAIAALGLYTYAAAVVQARVPCLKNKRICLLIAHPDDEAMFFAPTLLALARPETGNHVKVLCLSTGQSLPVRDLVDESTDQVISCLHRQCGRPWQNAGERTLQQLHGIGSEER